MLKTTYYLLLGVLNCVISIITVTIIPVLILPLGAMRFLIPNASIRRILTHGIEQIALCWTKVNHFTLHYLTPTKWEIIKNGAIDTRKNYFVIANHQSWADILILEDALYKRTGFSRYFIKKNLLHVPLAGWACRMLNYPSMYRFTKTHLAKRPQDKGKDIEITRKVCQKLRGIHFKLNSFVEGTRFTAKKHHNQMSPYHHLLKPKAGGVAYALQVLYPQISNMIDLTIIYHCKKPNIFKLIFGFIPKITVHVNVFPITPSLIGDYQDNRDFRISFQNFINELWEAKDKCIAAVKKDAIMS